MDPHVLAELSRDRRRQIRADYARCAGAPPWVRPLVARLLRALGDRLFRLGVALDDARVSPAVVEGERP